MQQKHTANQLGMSANAIQLSQGVSGGEVLQPLILMKTQHVIPLQRERALSVLHRINLRVGAGDVLFNSSSILSPPTTAQDLTRITCP